LILKKPTAQNKSPNRNSLAFIIFCSSKFFRNFLLGIIYHLVYHDRLTKSINMKKILYFLFLINLSTVVSYGQSDIREVLSTFKFDISLDECDFDGTKKNPLNSQVMEKGWKFSIRNVVNDGSDYVIQVSKFTDDSPKSIAQNKLTYQKTNLENIYFKISSANYSAFAEEVKRRGSFVVGASTTLIKIRPGNGKSKVDEVIYSEFGNDFNIGVTAGWRLSNYEDNVSASLVGGIAFSSIKFTPQTTRGFVTSESTQSSITYSIGVIFEVDKFQISSFFGIDTVSGEMGKNWIYRDRPWIGLGFGFEIFKPQGKIDNSKKL
jgi:hypothetical protein